MTSDIIRQVTAIVLVLCALASDEERPQFVFWGYFGFAPTMDGDLEFDDATLDASWDDDSFGNPPYYGWRVGLFLHERSPWGVFVDFIHAKIVLEEPEAPVDSFEITHGHNMLLATGLYRFLTGERFEPYVGLGAGIAIPHVEATINGEFDGGFQISGPAFQALAGASLTVWGPFALFVEYKFTVAFLRNLEVPEGSVSLTPLTHHFVFGLAIRI